MVDRCLSVLVMSGMKVEILAGNVCLLSLTSDVVMSSSHLSVEHFSKLRSVCNLEG